MSDGITLCCPRCGKYSALHKECETFRGIDVYTCQDEECGVKFAIEMVVKGVLPQLNEQGGKYEK